MKKTSLRVPALLTALVCLLLLLPVPALAAATAGTADLIYLNESTNLVAIVEYQSQEPDLVFIAPNGDRYAESLDNLRVDRGDMVLYCHLPQAQAGQWQVEYDKKVPQELTISFVREASALLLNNLTAQADGTDGARLSFQADFPQDTIFRYTIYAAVTDGLGQVIGQRELTSGSAATNRAVELRVSFRSLATYDSYRLMAEAWLDDGGIEVYDTALFPDVFSYENPSTPSAIGGMSLTVDLEGQGLTADWQDWRVYGCDAYLLAVFRNDEVEPFFFQEYPSSITRSEILTDVDASSLRVELTYRRGGTMSATLSRTVDLSQGGWVSIATPEQTNSAQARVDYRLPAPLTVSLTLNDENISLPLEGEDFFSVNLQDGVNRLSVAWSPEENLTFVTGREISCDRIPPVLRLFETDGLVRTASATYLLAGQAEPGCTLRVAGQEVTPEEDGTFLYELSLTPGDNSFEVELTDPAGNRTVQQLSIRRALPVGDTSDSEPSGVLSFLPLILSAAGGLAVMLLGLLLFRKGKDGRRHVAGTMSVLLWILTGLSACAAGVCAFQYFVLSRRVNGSSFLEITQNSFAQAYEMLENTHLFARLAAGTGIAAAALALLALLFTLISRRKSGSKKPKAPGKNMPPKNDAPPAPPQP